MTDWGIAAPRQIKKHLKKLFDERCVRVACVPKGKSGSGLKSIAFFT
jgi:hypothetical protein